MKIQCSCGAKFAVDLTPEMATQPVKFVCPQCGLDSSDFVNQLIQNELAEQKVQPVPPPPENPVAPPKPAPARLKISHEEKPPAPPVETTPENFTSKYCPKHPSVLAVGRCMVCKKPICPKCMEEFGFFCSPFCQNKADLQGIEAPVYAGQKFHVQKQFWRQTGLIFGSLAALVVLGLGFGMRGSVPCRTLIFRCALTTPIALMPAEHN
jgi:hypothetical protein